MLQKNNNFTRYALVFAILTVVIVAGAYTYRSAAYKQLDAFKLIPRPERFTELYFENHTNLPKTKVKNETIFFSFTVHNLEGKDMQYPYVVYFKNNYGTTTVEKSGAFVKDNEYKTITESYTFKSNSPQETLYVELTDKHQELHFALSGADK